MSESAMWTNHGDAIYLNADKSAVVPGDSPDAAYLLVANGGQIPIEVAKQYGLVGSQLPKRGRKEEEEEEGRKAKDAPPNKLRQPEPDNKRR